MLWFHTAEQYIKASFSAVSTDVHPENGGIPIHKSNMHEFLEIEVQLYKWDYPFLFSTIWKLKSLLDGW